MQRYNFQFTGQRFYRIRGGRLAGQLRDVAYQGDDHRLLGFDGGRRRAESDATCSAARSTAARRSRARWRAVSHGCPSALFRGVRILNTLQEAGR